MLEQVIGCRKAYVYNTHYNKLEDLYRYNLGLLLKFEIRSRSFKVLVIIYSYLMTRSV